MVNEELKQFKDDICRHFDVATERIEDKIQIIAEQVASNTEDITSIKDNVEIMKSDIGIIKNDLVQKISRDEFFTLEKRVTQLESKSHK